MDVHDRQTSSLLISIKTINFFLGGYDFKICSFHPILSSYISYILYFEAAFVGHAVKQRISGSFVKSRSFRVKQRNFPGAFFRELSSKRSHRYPATSGVTFWSRDTSGMFFFLKLPFIGVKKRLNWLLNTLKYGWLQMYSYFISIFRDTSKLSHISNRVEDDGWDKMLKWRWSSQVLTVAVRVACLQGTLCGVPISIRPLTTTPTTWKTTPLKNKSTVKVHPGFPSKNSKFGLLPNVIPLYPTRVYEGWVSSTSFTILYLRTCFLMMWERQMYIWQKSFFRFPLLWSYNSHTGDTPFRRYLEYPCTSCNM